MIDWHSHVLPALDDGASDVNESIKLVRLLNSQGVGTIIATPHFYADDESVESFLNRRNIAYEDLKNELDEKSPKIILGAEVRYYQGISRLTELDALRIEGSKLLLLEMPMSRWTEYMIRELVELSTKSRVRIILAHVERYLPLQKLNVIDNLLQCGILTQANASFLNSFATKRNALSMLDKGMIHFVGSDCHNLTSRAPQIGRAMEIIKKKFGDNFIEQMNEYGLSLLTTSSI